MPLGRRQIQIFAVSAHYHRTGCTYGNEIRYHMEMKLGIQAHHNHTCIKVEFFSGMIEQFSTELYMFPFDFQNFQVFAVSVHVRLRFRKYL